MAQKQFNSPMAMYSEEALEEIMTEGTLGYVIDFSNLNCIYLLTFKNTSNVSLYGCLITEENLSTQKMR